MPPPPPGTEHAFASTSNQHLQTEYDGDVADYSYETPERQGRRHRRTSSETRIDSPDRWTSRPKKTQSSRTLEPQLYEDPEIVSGVRYIPSPVPDRREPPRRKTRRGSREEPERFPGVQYVTVVRDSQDQESRRGRDGRWQPVYESDQNDRRLRERPGREADKERTKMKEKRSRRRQSVGYSEPYIEEYEGDFYRFKSRSKTREYDDDREVVTREHTRYGWKWKY
jgi:hypothetical protein